MLLVSAAEPAFPRARQAIVRLIADGPARHRHLTSTKSPAAVDGPVVAVPVKRKRK